MAWFKSEKKPSEKEKAAPPVQAAATAEGQSAVPNSLNAPEAKKPSFFERAKAKFKGLGQSITKGAVSAYDTVMNAADDFHDWRKERKKKKEAEKAAKANEEPGAIKKFFSNAGNFIKDKASSAGKFIKEKASSAGNYIKNSAVGKAVASAASKVGGGIKSAATTVGGGIKSAVKKVGGGLKSAGGFIKDKAAAAGNYIKESKLGKGVSSLAHAAGEKLGAAKDFIKEKASAAGNYIKNSKVGQTVARAGKAVKNAGVKAINYAGEKTANVKKFISDKKTAVSDFLQDKVEAIRQHDLERYEKHKMEKNSGYSDMLDALSKEMDEDEDISANIQRRKDVGKLGRYDEDSRSYRSAEEQEAYEQKEKKDRKEADEKAKAEGKITNTAKKALGLSKDDDEDSIKGILKNAKTGNMQAAIRGGLSKGDSLMEKAEELIGDNLPSGVLTNAYGMVKSGVSLGMHTKNRKALQKIDQEGVGNEVQGEDKDAARDRKQLQMAYGMMDKKLGRDQREDVSNLIQSGVSTATSIVPGLSTVGKAVNKGVSIGTSFLNSRDRGKENKKIAREDVFGSEERYRELKKKYGLSKKDMELVALRKMGYTSMDQVAELSRAETAQTVHRHSDKGSVKKMLSAGSGIDEEHLDDHMDMDKTKESLDVDDKTVGYLLRRNKKQEEAKKRQLAAVGQ